MRFNTLTVALMAVVMAAPVRANPRDAAALCEVAASRASEETGVPLRLLQAISLVESGRSRHGQRRPWPWTVHHAGQGHWFDTRQEAAAFLRDRQAEGADSFDVGCFQLNHRWHNAAFHSAEAMLDPQENARYAASFLRDLRDREGDWSAAVGAYHSATPDRAEAYRARFDAIYAELEPGPPDTMPPPPRRNHFPLLLGRGSGASLVPLPASARRLIGE